MLYTSDILLYWQSVSLHVLCVQVQCVDAVIVCWYIMKYSCIIVNVVHFVNIVHFVNVIIIIIIVNETQYAICIN